MVQRMNIGIALGLAVAGSVGALAAFSGEVSPSGAVLAVREGSAWVTWWEQQRAPHEWTSRTPLADRVRWLPAVAGVEWSELQLRGSSEAWRTRLVVARIDPRQIDLRVVPAFARQQSWSVDADTTVALAFDAGQFRHSLPYGWVVSQGVELLKPEYAPLAGAVIVDSSGAVRIVDPDEVNEERRRGGAREAFQSYPMLLQDGIVPFPLRQTGAGVNLAHRDARLALGTQSDGRVVIAITRFDALGPSLGRIPFGLTTPEMAAIMGALGCHSALLLDGGISGQLSLRDRDGIRRRWPGSRGVPLGLVGRSR
jgi:uncharacterized protein YigE (DUF2233 family)